MSQFVDWEYYSSLHTIVTEEAFERSEALAEKEIQRVIGWIRWAGITGDTFSFEQLKDCICNVMDKLAKKADKKEIENIKAGIADVDSALNSTSTNSVQNKVVKAALDGKLPYWDVAQGTGDLNLDNLTKSGVYMIGTEAPYTNYPENCK